MLIFRFNSAIVSIMNSDFTFFLTVSFLGFVFFGLIYLLKRYYILKSKNNKNLHEKDEE